MGRPKGSRDLQPRKRRKPEDCKQVKVAKSRIAISKDITIDFLIEDALKTYKKLTKFRDNSTIDELNANAKDMIATAKLAYATQLNSYHVQRSSAEAKLKELEDSGKIGGISVPKERRDFKKLSLRNEINAPYKIDSRLTTLRGEITKALAEIERIEAGSDKTSISIYQIMSGKGDKDQNEVVKAQLFEFPNELSEPEDAENYIDVEAEGEDL